MTDGTEQYNPAQSIDNSPVYRGEVFAFHAFMCVMCSLVFFVLLFFSFELALKVLVQGFFLLASLLHASIAVRVGLDHIRGEE